MSKQSVVKIVPGNQKVMLDMNYLGTKLMRDDKALSAVINKWQPNKFLGFFGGLFGFSTDEASAVGLAVIEQQLAESFIRWRINDNQLTPDYIVSDNQIPEVVVAGVTYQMEISSSWAEKEAQYLLEDGKSMIVMINRNSTVGAGASYDFQLVGRDGDVLVDRKLLSPNRALNYAGNIKSELSTTSQPIKDYGSYDAFNVTTTSRHEFAASGHALSTKTVDSQATVYEEMGADGKTESYMLPFTGKMIDFHLEHINTQLIKGVSNFNIGTRTITNKSPFNQRPELPSGAGFEEQMRYTDVIDQYSPLQGAVVNKNKIKNAISKHANYIREKGLMYVAVTRGGGFQVLHDILDEEAKRQFIMTPQNKKINVGFNFDTYTTVMGDMVLMNLDWSLPRGFKEEMVMYNGVEYPKSSFDIMLIPIIKMTGKDGKPKTNIRIYTKAKTVGTQKINRGLVIGTLPGMTGLMNSTGLDLLKASDAAVKNVLSGNYNISSATDGEMAIALSEFALVVDCPDMIYRLEAVFPKYH